MTGGIDVNRLTGFLLTHPVWDVTINTVYINKSKNQISTHTSRVGCDPGKCYNGRIFNISTHTSRVGCDSTAPTDLPCEFWNFYSHIPCGM